MQPESFADIADFDFYYCFAGFVACRTRGWCEFFRCMWGRLGTVDGKLNYKKGKSLMTAD
jgi:hypothetical protein